MDKRYCEACGCNSNDQLAVTIFAVVIDDDMDTHLCQTCITEVEKVMPVKKL